MNDENRPARGPRAKRLAGIAGVLAVGAITGGVVAATLPASASNTTNTANSATAATSATASHGPRRGPVGGATPVRPGEKSLSSSDAAQVRAAALKAVPGGTVYRVETDADGAVYEAHMTRSNGTAVTVKLDKGFNVTAVQNGMGSGGPGGHGNPPAMRGSSA
jgi:anti-sigma factor ChrR (cupin superfamily)